MKKKEIRSTPILIEAKEATELFRAQPEAEIVDTIESEGREFVVGDGPTPCNVMLVGEAPGAEEDRTGKPFSGPSGQLLNQLIESAGLRREEVYVTNCFRFRPPANRKPTEKELLAHAPYLIREIELVKPKVIVLLGATPLLVFLNKTGITKCRGQLFPAPEFGCRLVATYHPAYLLHSAGDTSLQSQVIADLSLARAISEGKEPTSVQRDRKPVRYHLIDTLDKFRELKAHLLASKIFEFDIETTGMDIRRRDIICTAFSIDECEAFVVPWMLNWLGEKFDTYTKETYNFWGIHQEEVWQGLTEILESEVEKSAHNGDFDILFYRAKGLKVKSFTHDTLLMHYLLNENAKSHGLKELAAEFTDMGGYDDEIDSWKSKLAGTPEVSTFFTKAERLMTGKKPLISFSWIPFGILWKYAAADADATGRLRRIFQPELERQGLYRPAFRRILMPAYETIIEMEWKGIKVDRDALAKLREVCQQKVDDLDKQLLAEKSVQTLASRLAENKKSPKLNLNSTKQLQVLLFDILRLRSVRKTDTGQNSVDKHVLEVLSKHHDIPRLLKERAEHVDLMERHGENFEAFIDGNNRIHSAFKLWGTETGRLNSRNPNLENISRDEKDSETGEKKTKSLIRKIYVATEGYTFVEADFSQLQYRLWAHYSQDAQMLDDIINGRDIHIMTAAAIFGKRPEEISKDERQMGKTFVYTVIMGGTEYSISNTFGIERDEAREWIQRWFVRYPGANRYNHRMVESAKALGYVQGVFGCRRRLPEILSMDMGTRSHAEREAKCAPLQQTEAHILFITMNRIRKEFDNSQIRAELLIPTHDSILAESPDEYVEKTIQIMQTEMSRSIPGITVPLEVDLKVGKNLGAMEKIVKNKG